MLTIDQLIDLEVRIQDELVRIQDERASSEVEREAVSPDVSIGRLSRLDSMQMQEVAKDAERRREQRVYELEAAQERIDCGEYGQCEACGEWIAYDRLEAQPEAVRCGKCAG
jgi:DnaK suppressor protein